MTQRERDILHRRISRALCWSQVPEPYRNEANRLATVVLDEMDKSATSAATQRRAVQNIVTRLEQTA
jgi:hypothetical protein